MAISPRVAILLAWMSCCSAINLAVISLAVTSRTSRSIYSKEDERILTKIVLPSIRACFTLFRFLNVFISLVYCARSLSSKKSRKDISNILSFSIPYTVVALSLQSKISKVFGSRTKIGLGMVLKIVRYFSSDFLISFSRNFICVTSRLISIAEITSPLVFFKGEVLTIQKDLVPSLFIPVSSLVCGFPSSKVRTTGHISHLSDRPL